MGWIKHVEHVFSFITVSCHSMCQRDLCLTFNSTSVILHLIRQKTFLSRLQWWNSQVSWSHSWSSLVETLYNIIISFEICPVCSISHKSTWQMCWNRLDWKGWISDSVNSILVNTKQMLITNFRLFQIHSSTVWCVGFWTVTHFL